ncbi:carbonic anhydrase [Sphingomonas sp. H39-1-10]|uniref:carbonic anhydrase n=1 Tax=Sphingomonas TaxID=13687 RepID=UPI00088D0547|nr:MULTISPECIES: carbonic anhydrase [Sphingomonas]MDF0486906.1 carbonic anhydrase [Sphingomonas pollutisoli]SDA34648.1 carbonic anhydrase [Sphingomonas sp. NFR15]
MNELIGRVFSFEKTVFPNQSALFGQLVRDGQSPKALMISCADSRIVPEQVLQANPGDLFVCRNAGNIVPPYGEMLGGVSATVEYAVMALGVRDIIVCGHSDCGAMKAVANPKGLDAMPNVASWLKHSAAAESVVSSGYSELSPSERVHAIALENVVAQIAHLRTHPSVAAGIARGEISLHGWLVDIHAGQVLGLDGTTGRFVPMREGSPLPVAHAAAQRLAADFALPEAAE